jgi:plasmid stabilization system protein ParE
VKVVLTDQAIADLIAIGRFIREDNPARAVTFVPELKDKCFRIGQMPKAFPLIIGREKGRHPPPSPWQLPDFLLGEEKRRRDAARAEWGYGLRSHSVP